MNVIYSTAGGLRTIADAVYHHTICFSVVYVPQHVDCNAYTAHLADFVRNCQRHNGDCDQLLRAVHIPLSSTFPILHPDEEAAAIEHVLSGLDSADVPQLTRLLEIPRCTCCHEHDSINAACSNVHRACHEAIHARIAACSV